MLFSYLVVRGDQSQGKDQVKSKVRGGTKSKFVSVRPGIPHPNPEKCGRLHSTRNRSGPVHPVVDSGWANFN
jgi:hypothetical protein